MDLSSLLDNEVEGKGDYVTQRMQYRKRSLLGRVISSSILDRHNGITETGQRCESTHRHCAGWTIPMETTLNECNARTQPTDVRIPLPPYNGTTWTLEISLLEESSVLEVTGLKQFDTLLPHTIH